MGSSQTGGNENPHQPSGGDINQEVLDAALEAHQSALEDLVNANSILTLAVFIGLSVVQPGDTTFNLQGDKKCNADPLVLNNLVVNEVLSFAFYLLSSLVAKALKAHLYTYRLNKTDINHMGSKLIRASMLSISTWGSILGSVFLTISMHQLIEIRLGKTSCKNTYTLQASGTLIALVVTALTIYMVFMMHAIFISVRTFETSAAAPAAPQLHPTTT